MLEVRYRTDTKVLTGWCGDEEQFGNLKDRGDEVIVILDIPIPTKPLQALLYNETTQALVANPDYVEPEPVMDYKAEILKLKDEIKKLKDKD